MRKDGVLLGEGNVGFLICDNILRLQFGLREAVPCCSNVPLVHVLHIFGVRAVHSVDLGLICLAVQFVEDNVKLVSTVFDLFLNDLLNAWPESSKKDRLGQSEEELMVRFLHLDIDVLNVDVHLGNFEEVLAITRRSSLGSDLEAKTLTTHEEIADTSILNFRETLLALHVEGDITKVHLDTRDSQYDLVLILVGNLFPAPTPIVVCAEFENVGSEVVAFNDKILDHDVDGGIRVLDARDRNVSDVNQDFRNDNLGQVLDEMRLESWFTVFIIAKVKEQLLHGIAECLVLWVSLELVTDELDFVKDTVGVTTVFVAKEKVAPVVKCVPAESQSSL